MILNRRCSVYIHIVDPISIPNEVIHYSNVTIEENNDPNTIIDNVISVNDSRLNSVVFHYGTIITLDQFLESPIMSVLANGSLCIHESLNYEHQSIFECLVLVYLANSHVPVAMVPLSVFVVDISFFIPFCPFCFLTSRE